MTIIKKDHSNKTISIFEMKRATCISIVIAGIALFSSCSESFLDVDPIGLSYEENYYSTDEEVSKGLNAAYDLLVLDYSTSNEAANSEGHGYGSSYMMRNIASDDANAGGGNALDIPGYQEMDEFRLTTQNASLLSHWQRCYYGIFRCNLIINHAYADTTNAIDEYIAEAKFLRAYYYWELVTFFGEVPIVDWVISTAETYPAKKSVNEVYAFIEKDLLEAMEALPLKSEQSSGNKHRASKGAAQALLSKAYMFQQKYSEAAQVMEQLFNSSEYALDKSYAHIFSIAGEFGIESIFEISYTNKYASDWEANRSRAIEGNVNSQLMGVRGLGGNPYYYAGWGFNKVEVSLMAAFDAENDSVRKYNSAYGDEFFTAHSISYTDNYKKTGWWCKKMAPDAESFSDGSGASELDYAHNEVVMRLADFYLLYAEAEYQLGNESVARQYIDSVRLRANLAPISSSISGQDLFNSIVKERRLELALEGHRYFDVIRWGLAGQYFVNQWGGSYTDKNKYFPIPQQEIDRSGGVLKQNTDYQ